MKYCSNCAGEVELRVPPGDNRPRHVCTACGVVYYHNPKIVVGAIPEWDGRVLLCRRAIEPRLGLWTLPAGFMENGETTQQGAARETLEEAGARVRLQGLYSMFNLPHIDQVYLLFRGPLESPEFAPGDESLEVDLFDEAQIPWDRIAFPVVRETLRLYFRDRAAGGFGVHCGDILREPGETRRYRVILLDQVRRE